MAERRSEIRMLCADMVDVVWTDLEGVSRRGTALLEDISSSGACLQFEFRVPVGCTIRFVCKGEELEATVRYCVYREIGYFVGVVFAPGGRWSAQRFKPNHMLDPTRVHRRK